MHPTLKKFLILGGVILLISGGLLAWRFGWVPQIGKFFASEPNRPPSVSLKSSGGCLANCTAFFEATAADLDGDSLSYAWSGCASGTDAKARCPITGSATVATATVTVSDGHGGQTSATITAQGFVMQTAADFSGKYIIFNGNYRTPNGGTPFLGYAALSADGTATMYYIKTQAADNSNTTKKHNAMRLTPGMLPPNYNPNCQPGFIRAGNFRMIQRTGSWSFNGSSLQVYIPNVEYTPPGVTPEAYVGFTFSWTPEQGSPTQSLILRSVVGDNQPPWYAGGYGYAFLSSQSPYSTAPLLASQFSENYWGLSAIYGGFGGDAGWSSVAPELTDAYMNSLGGFFPIIPAFFAPPLALGYYTDADPNVLGRTLLLTNDVSLYGNHTWLFNYADENRPFMSNNLMYWHGGHDFSDNGCYDPASDSGGHILAVLGVLEGGEMTKLISFETGSEAGKVVFSRWFKVAYPSVTGGPPPPGPDQNAVGSNDGATYTALPTEGGGIIAANSVFGWSFDPDAPTQTVTVHLYFDGEPGSCPVETCVVRPVTADTIRGDVNRVFGITGNHGFTFDLTQLPARFLDNQNHTVSAYAINIPPQGQAGTATNPLLGTKTFSLTVPDIIVPPTPPQGLTNVCSGDNDNGNVVLSWQPVSGATAYHIRADETTNNSASCQYGWFCSDPPDKIVDNLTATTYTLPVTQGKTYNWWVHAANSSGNSEATVGTFICGGTTTIPGDANGDGHVNILDFNMVISYFGQTGAEVLGDVNSDGTVNILDFNMVISYFGQ